MVLTHDQIWKGIDRLALRNQMSPSGLAKRSGLDPTTFNKSKRITKEGKLRWPSTESLAKILDATNTTIGDFVGLLDNGVNGSIGVAARLKCIPYGQIASSEALDESGYPHNGDWDEIEFPSIDDSNAYIVELDEDIEPPVFRAGDLLVVSPSSSIRRYDRVLARRKSGHLTIAIMIRRTAQRVTFGSITGSTPEFVADIGELSWMARVVWASQ